ncbi:hypothetical protein ECEC1862_2275, partial [Escherichia coli EC1862]
EEQS